jgi:hypothetical protein
MKVRDIQTSNGKKITVIDDAFSLQKKIFFENFAINSKYTNSGEDYVTDFSLSSGVRNLVSRFTEEDFKNLGLIGNCEYIDLFLKDKVLSTYKIHLLTLANVSVPHTDNSQYTFLLYPNVHWDVRWGGETVFYSEDLTEIEYTSLYVPGRVIIFDGSIPHMGRAPTVLATHPRYTFAMSVNEAMS